MRVYDSLWAAERAGFHRNFFERPADACYVVEITLTTGRRAMALARKGVV